MAEREIDPEGDPDEDGHADSRTRPKTEIPLRGLCRSALRLRPSVPALDLLPLAPWTRRHFAFCFLACSDRTTSVLTHSRMFLNLCPGGDGVEISFPRSF